MAGRRFSSPGSATFEPRERAARTARNPSTGAQLELAPPRAVGFEVGATFKQEVADSLTTAATKKESGTNWGGHAASACRSAVWAKPGYQRWKSAASSSLRTRVRIWRSRWAPRGVQRICCFFTMRLLMTWLTADSMKELEMVSPARWRSP